MPKKIVYFAGAMRGDRVVADNMKAMVIFIRDELKYPVLTEHVVKDQPIESLPAEEIEKRDINWLDTATHVIAEISGASTGTGREIEYARTKGTFGKTPAYILCLYRADLKEKASPMIRGMDQKRYPNVTIAGYDTMDMAKKLIKKFLVPPPLKIRGGREGL